MSWGFSIWFRAISKNSLWIFMFLGSFVNMPLWFSMYWKVHKYWGWDFRSSRNFRLILHPNMPLRNLYFVFKGIIRFLSLKWEMSLPGIMVLVIGWFLQKFWLPHQQCDLVRMLRTAFMHLRDDWRRHITGRYEYWRHANNIFNASFIFYTDHRVSILKLMMLKIQLSMLTMSKISISCSLNLSSILLFQCFGFGLLL